MLLSAGHQSDPTIHICILSHIIFHYGLSQDINYSSLCYTIGPCGPSFLYIIVCIYQPKFPAHPSPCPLWQLQVCSLCEPVTMIWQEKGRKKKKKKKASLCEDTTGKDCLVSFWKTERVCYLHRPSVSDFPVRASFLWLCRLAVLQQDFQSAEICILSHHLRPTESETLEGSTKIYIFLKMFKI